LAPNNEKTFAAKLVLRLQRQVMLLCEGVYGMMRKINLIIRPTKYQVVHTHLKLKGKLLADKGYIVTPWLRGKSQLKPASGQLFNSGLSLSQLYTNGFLLNLTYSA